MQEICEKLVNSVEQMRKCQRALKKMYTDANKKALAEAEKDVDCIINEYKKNKQEQIDKQFVELFD